LISLARESLALAMVDLIDGTRFPVTDPKAFALTLETFQARVLVWPGMCGDNDPQERTE
jgi:hypothetical protein